MQNHIKEQIQQFGDDPTVSAVFQGIYITERVHYKMFYEYSFFWNELSCYEYHNHQRLWEYIHDGNHGDETHHHHFVYTPSDYLNTLDFFGKDDAGNVLQHAILDSLCIENTLDAEIRFLVSKIGNQRKVLNVLIQMKSTGEKILISNISLVNDKDTWNKIINENSSLPSEVASEIKAAIESFGVGADTTSLLPDKRLLILHVLKIPMMRIVSSIVLTLCVRYYFFFVIGRLAICLLQ